MCKLKFHLVAFEGLHDDHYCMMLDFVVKSYTFLIQCVKELTGRWTQNAEADTGIDSLKVFNTVQSRYTSKLTAQGGSTQSTGKTQELDN